MNTSKLIIFIAFFTLLSCGTPSAKTQVALYERQCASCHLTPSITHLPKDICATKILTDMGARMGMKDSIYNPLMGVPYEEVIAIFKSGIYPVKPTMAEKDWKLLQEYIITMAPDSLVSVDNRSTSTELNQFIPIPISLDTNEGSFITYLKYNSENNNILIGDIQGNLSTYNINTHQKSTIKEFSSAVVDYTDKGHISYTTIVGKLDPSEIPLGKIVSIKNDNTDYEKKVLLNQPGTFLVLSRDMDKDGKEDLIA